MGAALPFAMAGMSAGGTALSVMGSLKQAKAQKKQAAAQNELAKFQAAQLEQQATQTQAAGQYAALEQKRQSEILQSRALAIAGASGGGTLDPTVLKVISGLAVEGERAAQTETYNAESQASAERLQAASTRYEGYLGIKAGNVAAKASKMQAFSTALSGLADAGSMAYFGMSTPRGVSGNTPSFIDFQRGINRGGFN